MSPALLRCGPPTCAKSAPRQTPLKDRGTARIQEMKRGFRPSRRATWDPRRRGGARQPRDCAGAHPRAARHTRGRRYHRAALAPRRPLDRSRKPGTSTAASVSRGDWSAFGSYDCSPNDDDHNFFTKSGCYVDLAIQDQHEAPLYGPQRPLVISGSRATVPPCPPVAGVR